MRFAFIIMGDFDYQKDFSSIHNSMAQIIGVKNLDEAVEVAGKLQKDRIDSIELCGAFDETGAKRIIDVTNNTIPIGYVTHLPIQNDVYQKAFKTDKKKQE